jgi:hypothetical protein
MVGANVLGDHAASSEDRGSMFIRNVGTNLSSVTRHHNPYDRNIKIPRREILKLK